MINIICFIAITIMAPMPGNKIVGPRLYWAEVHGHIVSESEDSYVVDFSQEAKEKGFVGVLSQYNYREVQKSMCTKLQTGIAVK